MGNSHQRQLPHPHMDTQLQRQQLRTHFQKQQLHAQTQIHPHIHITFILTATLTHRYCTATSLRVLYSQTTTTFLDTDHPPPWAAVHRHTQQPFSDLRPPVQPSDIHTLTDKSCVLRSRHPGTHLLHTCLHMHKVPISCWCSVWGFPSAS